MRSLCAFFLIISLGCASAYSNLPTDPELKQAVDKRFFKACWDAETSGALYIPLCTDTVIWRKDKQIRVFLVENELTIATRGEIGRAMGTWNSIIGWEKFAFTYVLTDANVIVGHTGATAGNTIASVRHYRKGDGDYRVLLHVFMPHTMLPAKQRDTVMIHELGHVLGLRHDLQNEGSVMYPRIQDHQQLINYEDGSLIRHIYKR